MRTRGKSGREIAPKLANGDPRVHLWGRLPDNIKEGLRHIAMKEGRSMSWVVENVIVDYFGLPKPRYLDKAAKVRGKRR